ncbi:hypothetical protein [Massilia sp. ZL223]|uniref:hypothetical protein n=1 Tax=Massilia sp. ZL223 TaxID=2824904 RepID=UPI001B838B6F|nr:hypothetical protein [Massilia sp. ZL223]MBQ5965062.1 hypothetical protein [Massilia sp. ZL223]
MASIVIKDLTESTELDRKAMLAIAGGSRMRAGGGVLVRPAARRVRLYDISAGSAAQAAATRPPSR